MTSLYVKGLKFYKNINFFKIIDTFFKSDTKNITNFTISLIDMSSIT